MTLSNHELQTMCAQFIDGINPKLKYFTGNEILSTYASIRNGAHNSAPPVQLWANIIPTVQFLDRLREELGYPIHLTSVYRNDAYNAAVDGSTDSMHKYFNAMDFYGHNGNPLEWRDALVMLEKTEGWKIGGLKAYPKFVHLDTRHILGRKIWKHKV